MSIIADAFFAFYVGVYGSVVYFNLPESLSEAHPRFGGILLTLVIIAYTCIMRVVGTVIVGIMAYVAWKTTS